MITLRPDQAETVDRLREALSRHQSVLLRGACGFGKCLGRDTPVLMFDGTIRMVQDVQKDDLLMGPDSLPRRVLSVCKGAENLYRVTPKKGDAYVVNESHILSLRGQPGVKNKIVNIGVLDYLSSSRTFKGMYRGWRAAVNFSSSPLKIDPYFFGLWLGDGSSRAPSVTTGDEEIVSWLSGFASENGLSVRVEDNSENSVVVHLTTASKKGGIKRNPITNQLRSYNLILNKHVPLAMRTASREDRLKILAGYLDADGYYNGCFEAVSISREIADGIAFIARSVGLAAYIKPCEKTCTNNGAVGRYYRIKLSGDLHEIPCKIGRKRASVRRIKKNVLNVGISVEPIGPGEYFGFEIDGDRLFMLGDFTVTHNTVVAAYMASGANAKNKRVIFGVHRIELARQTALTFEKFGIPFGHIMAGKPSNPLARVQIASVDTLRRRPSLIGCDLFIPDEAHLWSGASRKAIIDQVRKDGAHIVPLTATPMFPDGRAIGGMADAIVSGPSERWLIEQGHLARYRAFAPAVMDMAGIHTRMGDYVVADLEERFSKPRLYGDAVAAYRKFADGRRMIGYCYSRKHGGEMAAAFTAAGVPAAFIDGETPDAERRRVIADFADGRVPVLMNCQLFREGFDLSAQVGRDVPIQAVGLYNPTKSPPLAIQMMMRGMRPQAEPSIILDHANVLRDHGLPDDDREWSLEGSGRKKKQMDPTIPTTTCGNCWATFRPSQPCCPYCGYKRDIHDRQIEVITEAQIEEIDPDLVRQARRAEQDKVNLRVRSARSLNDLCRVAIELGRNAGWVYNVYRNRPDGRRDLPYAAVVRAMKEAA